VEIRSQSIFLVARQEITNTTIQVKANKHLRIK
jgi:hypothetical protein